MTATPPPPPAPRSYDALIIGSGLAGLATALLLPTDWRIAIVTKRALADGSSAWAQGGIAAVLGEGDSFEQHIHDTLVAGAGLCDPDATRFTVEHAPEAIAWLRALGTPFTQEGGELHLTREGGHSHRRIVHAADATGAAVQQTLIDRVRAAANIDIFETHALVDLILSDRHAVRREAPRRVLGAYVLDVATDEVEAFTATHTVL